MRFTELQIPGVYLIESDPVFDERGFFARIFCREVFISQGLNPNISQCNLSYNQYKGTIRGLHYQAKPHEETKVVSCVRGEIFDVVVDIRQNSPTYSFWLGRTLSDKNHLSMYIPNGCAHGFQSMIDDTTVLYFMGEQYHAENSVRFRYDEPKFGITWPLPPVVISSADREADYLI